MRIFNKTFIYININLMFTIFNVINYMTGKYIPLSLLILITIGIYYYIIGYCFENVFSNNYYLISILILMLLDITSLIVIFIYGDFIRTTDSNQYLNLDENKNNKKQMKNKKDKKDKKIKKDKKKENNKIYNKEKIVNNNDCSQQSIIKSINVNNTDNPENPNNPNNLNNPDKEIITLYDKENSNSIHTFIKQIN